VSALSNVLEFPVGRDVGGQLDDDIVLALATADDLASGMGRVVEWVRRSTGAGRVEWWASDDDGGLELVAAEGAVRGKGRELWIGRVGVFVLHGGRIDSNVESALMSLASIVRRRAAEERLARATIRLAQRNEALEDFAALVAHELKTPLQAALVAADPSKPVEDALDLVDALLEAAHQEPSERTFAPVKDSLDEAVEDLRVDVEVTHELATTLPLPPQPLRVILRNLLSNAVSAGAEHIHVTAVRSLHSWQLLVDDDGVGLDSTDGYSSGSGLGLSLSRRMAGRFGGAVELAPLSSGGTRASLTFTEALA
jgi:signal transduction histidine kinase